MSTFRPAYPGGFTTAQKRRDAARKAGIASGVARRQRSTCRRPPRARSGQDALSLKYNIRQVGAEEFQRLYREMCDRDGLTFDVRGLRTCHELYKQQMTAYRAMGQDWETTNAQIAAGLAKRGRARCRRTVQRQRQRLVAMGLLAYSHVKRSGALRLPGKMDSLRARCLLRRANVTPPPGAGASISPPGKCSARSSFNGKRQRLLSPPPTAADDVGRRCAAPGTEEGDQMGIGEQLPPSGVQYASEDERRFAYLELCETHAPAFLGVLQKAELARLRSRFGSGHDTARTDSIAAEGER